MPYQKKEKNSLLLYYNYKEQFDELIPNWNIIILNEISIKTESSNNFINENNLTNNNHYKLSTIPRIEETFESLN